MRTILGTIGLGLSAIGFSPAADPAVSKSPPPLEFALLGEKNLLRVEVVVEVNNVPIPAIWDETFAKLFAYFDRNSDGFLDTSEAGRLPSAKAFRHAMGNGFTPPVGSAPEIKELDKNGDGKVTLEELATYYRAAGLGKVQVGVGRLPASAELTAALLKKLDDDDDGKVTEKEWSQAVDALRKLDKNDDELIGAGELVPKNLYPGASGSILMTPPAVDGSTELLDKLPLVMLPANRDDTAWMEVIAKRNGQFQVNMLPQWRQSSKPARWTVHVDQIDANQRVTILYDKVRVDGWVSAGKIKESLETAHKQILNPSESAPRGQRRGGVSNNEWLLPIADRNGNGSLEPKEIEEWFALQTQIARGQVLLTVLDSAGLFELLDINHDGALSVRELRSAWPVLKEAGLVADGAYDPKKLPRMMLLAVSQGYPQTLVVGGRRGPEWFRAMDRNGDGDVSRREFTGPADLFDKLDLDKDGLLSPDEAEKVGSITMKK